MVCGVLAAGRGVRMMASPDHAAKRPATALIRAFLDMPSEDRFQTVMEDPSTLDALLIEADALVAALAQAEHERDEARKHANKLGRELDEQGDELERAERQRDQAIEALRTIHTSPICFIDCTERVGAVLATLDPDAAT